MLTGLVTPTGLHMKRRHHVILHLKSMQLIFVSRYSGTHLKIPWFETPITYDVRAKPRIIASLTGTKGTTAAVPMRRQ